MPVDGLIAGEFLSFSFSVIAAQKQGLPLCSCTMYASCAQFDCMAETFVCLFAELHYVAHFRQTSLTWDINGHQT